MTLEELEARIQVQEDIEEIRKLQYAYGYYIQHWQEDEIVKLFSKDSVIDMGLDGFYKGKEGIKKFFSYPDRFKTTVAKAPPEFLHQLMPLSGIIDVDPDGKTAKGRWYGFGVYALPTDGKVQALFGSGIWENQFVKEDGKWKFMKLQYSLIFKTPYEDGWVQTPIWKGKPIHKDISQSAGVLSAPYPSGYVEPYHYKNPVTGK
jgi:hypothetical protein